MISYLYLLSGIGVGILLGYLLKGRGMKSEMKLQDEEHVRITAHNQYLQATLQDTKTSLIEKEQEVKALLQENATLGSENEYLKGAQNKLKKDLEDSRSQMQKDFELLAQRIFDEKTTRFSQQNQQEIHALLAPFRENITSFRKQVEETYDKESKIRFSLEQRIAELVSLNNQISHDAKNLTKALKGNSKVQGDWGEMILESILERSGLQKNREYYLQATLKDKQGNAIVGEHGQKMRPDAMIVYPDNRVIIVDSKVSLTAYAQYMNEDAEHASRRSSLLDHITSIKKHINELAAKSYQDYTDTLDFVMMFIPNEGAYALAMQESPELWEFAYAKRVLLISPTNLITALRLVADLWKRENQNKNALEIAYRGGKLYDKFATLLQTLEEMGGHLKKANNTYAEALSQLNDGTGNLIGQVSKLRDLGAKAKKQLPSQ